MRKELVAAGGVEAICILHLQQARILGACTYFDLTFKQAFFCAVYSFYKVEVNILENRNCILGNVRN